MSGPVRRLAAVLAFILALAAGSAAVAQDTSPLGRFVDADQVSDAHRPSVERAVAGGVLQGDTHGRLRPREPMTREQVATVLDRMDLLPDVPAPDPDPDPTPSPDPDPDPDPEPDPSDISHGNELTKAMVGPRGDLAAYNGPDVITSDTVLEGGHSGRIVADGATVTLRDWKVTSPGTYGLQTKNGGRIIAEHVEVRDASSICILGDNVELYRVLVESCSDGLRAQSNWKVVESWVGAQVRKDGGHHDALQSLGGRNVTLLRSVFEGIDTNGGTSNAALMVSSNFSQVVGFHAESNLFSGGNYTVYLREKASAGKGAPRDVTFLDNIWVADSWSLGPLSKNVGVNWRWEGNRTSTGQPINL